MTTTPTIERKEIVVNTSQHPRWGKIDADHLKRIDLFETELRRVQSGQMEERVFLEFRLRHGVYGQRQEGVQMVRIKIPLGRLTLKQLEVLADVSEEYAVGISHVTTRQDIQMHYIDINDTPNMMRRLAEVGITTQEACGNVVRNVCACPVAGVCGTESFDVTPYAEAMAQFLLGHPDGQNFGRKFKIAYSGCETEACGLAIMHDLGAIAKTREVDGQVERGFKVYLGGGLGAVPHKAKVYSEFVPAEDMMPLAQAISRIFARLGEKRNRARARFKFVLAKVGIDSLREMVDEELHKLKQDPYWRGHLDELSRWDEGPLKDGSELSLAGTSERFQRWYDSNVQAQRQAGYSAITINLPLGDITADQLRRLAGRLKKYIGDTVRLTVDQNIVVRWVSNADLPALHEELIELDLALAGADRLADVTACPGTDSCKLGITSSRGLAATLLGKFDNGMGDIANNENLRVKISGCFNACGQHHVADVGFFGSVKKHQGHTAPMFQVVLGGTRSGNCESFGLPLARVPARRAPDVVRHLDTLYAQEAEKGEAFFQLVDRLGKKRLKDELKPFADLPSFEAEPELLKDNKQTWEYHMSTGVGECAGEVVDQAEFLLDDADRLHFSSSLKLEEGELEGSAELAFDAMKKAADGILSVKGLYISDEYDTVAEFQKHFGDGSFWKPTAAYFFSAAEQGHGALSHEQTHQRVEEARLFIEEAEKVFNHIS